MASQSYPNDDHNSGAVNNLEYERLTHAQAPDGLIGSPLDPAPVYADGTGTRLVKIRSELAALVRGSQWWSGDEDISLPSLDSNGSGQPRLDLVVLRLDRSDHTVTETVISGTPAASPVAPSPTADTGSTGTWDLPLATVRVENNATAITADKVTTVAWYINDDGGILCTAATRPPHVPNRVIYETDTKRLLVSNGSAWLRAVEDGTVTSIAMSSGYTATRNTLHIRNGWVFAQLSVRRASGSIPADSTVTVGTVPAGYRPPYLIEAPGVGTTAQQICAITVAPSGAVQLSPGPVPVLAGRSIIVALPPWPVA